MIELLVVLIVAGVVLYLIGLIPMDAKNFADHPRTSVILILVL
jgi:hypothetical protein